MILSNRKLRLIIITLLLLIFCFFLGMFKPKAENLSNYFNTTGFTDSNWYWNKYSIGIPTKSNIYYDLPHNIANIPEGTKNFNFNAYVVNHFDTSHLSCESESNGVCQIYKDTSSFLTMSFSYQYQYCSMNFMASNDSGNLFNVSCPVNNWYDGFLRFNVTNWGSENMAIDFGLGIYVGFDIDNNGSAMNGINNNTNDIKNSINDSNIDSNNANSSASSWNSKNATNGTITNLLTLPITLLQAIVNGLQTSCSSFSLGSLFGTNITLPCIDIGSLIGSGLFTTIDILFSGFMILSIGKKLIKIFNDFTNLKSNQMDELYGGGTQ